MKKAIMTMGLPGSGKSTALHNMNVNLAGFILIDPDEIKKEHPNYDPNQPELTHEWSQQETMKRLAEAIENGQNLIIDGTGTNVEKMVYRIKHLQKNGYRVEVVYVKVTLETALHRNANRERKVPETVVREKAEHIDTAYEIIFKYANDTTVIEND